jgi:plasmid stabilization system protein ParE
VSAFALIVHPTALASAIATFNYIAEQSSAAAASRWLADLDKAIQSLTEFPERFPIAREDHLLPSHTLRCVVVHTHRVLYCVKGDRVMVLCIRHGMRRDVDRLPTFE